jgi:hypothetical protein
VGNDATEATCREQLQALGRLLDRIIIRNQELVREVAALKRRIRTLERAAAGRTNRDT